MAFPRIPDPLPPESERDLAQGWFWTSEWLAGEREANEQIARGEGTLYLNSEEFLVSLA